MANDNILNAKKVVDDLTNSWENHIKTLTESTKVLVELNKEYKKVPSEYIKSVKALEAAERERIKTQREVIKNDKELEKLERERLKTTQSTEKASKKETKAIKAKIPTLRQLASIKKQAELQDKREQRLLERTQGLYNKVQRGINQVTRQYQDLALRKELNGKLSAEEEITLGKLEAKLNKYQSALKRVDANIGKHQRNVGNYKSGFDGLGFSIAQLSREMPAFANSMQTGFMAISNNIPMLVDEINKLKIANQQLSASGKPTVSILRQIGKSLFGWQTLISVGVTLLTVYGAKLFEWAFGMTEAEKATKKANEELEEQNKKLRENIDLRNRQVKGIREFLDDPKLNEAFKGILMGEESERANLALIELSDRLQKIGAKNAEVLKDQELSTRDRLNIAGNLLEIEKQQGKLQKERLRIDEILAGRQQGSTSLKETLRIQARILQLEQANEKLIGRKVELEIKTTKETKKQVRELTRVLNLRKGYTEDLKTLTEFDFGKGLEDIESNVEAFERWDVVMRRLKKNTEDFLSGFSNDLINNSPLGNLTMFLDGTFDTLIKGADTSTERFAVTFNAIAESAQQAFSFIDSLSQANYEAQYSRLEQQKNIAVQFAGDSTTAQAEIERQYEERRKQIQIRQAKAQKDQAIFNIGVDTAQAVVATLAQTPPPAGLPLAALVSAIGLAQLVAVQSQQIPQFWQGGEHMGGNLIMNDDPFGKKGRNYKEVAETPSGKLHTPQGKNVKMNLPKGTIIHPTYDAFVNSLDNELINNNIMPIGQSSIMPMVINNGLKRSDIQEVFSQEIGKLNKTIKNKKGVQIINDRRGQAIYEEDERNRRKIMNTRYNGKGIGV